MKKRHPAAVLLLPFVTLGVYLVYWLYATRKELLARTGDRDGIPPVLYLLLPFLVALASIPLLLFFFVGLESYRSDTSTVITTIVIYIIALLLAAAIALMQLWWFWKYCKAVALVTNGRGMDFTQLYVLYIAIVWVCGLLPVWMLLVQLEFNKLDEHTGGSTPHTPPAPIRHTT